MARAEVESSWQEVSRRFAHCLAPLGARWLAPAAYPGALHPEACIDVGPADPVGVTLREGLLLAHARTGPWGPGYHQRVVEVLDAVAAALPGGWQRVDDTTGYWGCRDATDLRRTFLRWAYSLWNLEESTAFDLDGVSVCMGLGEGPAEVPAGLVATPTGYKSRRWIRQTRAALRRAMGHSNGAPPPETARQAFLWWFHRQDAYDWIQLGRTICTTDVIWRPLEGEDAPAQVEARSRAATCFEEALRLDPASAVPTEELRRLYELLGRDQDAAALVASPDSEPFQGGYREGWIRRPLAGWNVQLPGWLRGTWDEQGGHDVFWDDRMTVHVTAFQQTPSSFSAREEAERHLELLSPTERLRARVELLDNGAVEGYAVLLPHGTDGLDTLVQGQVGRGDERVTFTCVVRSPEACAMALRLGRSLVPVA